MHRILSGFPILPLSSAQPLPQYLHRTTSLLPLGDTDSEGTSSEEENDEGVLLDDEDDEDDEDNDRLRNSLPRCAAVPQCLCLCHCRDPTYAPASGCHRQRVLALDGVAVLFRIRTPTFRVP